MATNPVFSDVPAWPEPAKVALAVVGHNKPPVEDEARAAFNDALLTERPDFKQKVDDIEVAATRAAVTDDESYAKAGGFVKTIRAALAHVDKAHADAKAPYLRGGKAVDTEKNALVMRLDGARGKVQARMNQYAADKQAREQAARAHAAAEERRRADEAAAAEARRVAAEREAEDALRNAVSAEERDAALARAEQASVAAEEASAAATLAATAVTKSEPVRSDDGATVSVTNVWNVAIGDDKADLLAAFKSVKDDPKVREAIEVAGKRRVRAGARELKGFRIWPTAQAVAR